MKTIKTALLAMFTIACSSVFAQSGPESTTQKTDNITVYGQCGMCKSRIQKALKIDGISSATWNTETKILSVTYSPATITNDEIQKKIAAIGHDTEKYEATEKAYNSLPGCCHYDRKK
ncbi:MAG: heavy-metal-associated domain-containing protein [Candidatus Dadabacteria bacterium]